MPITEHEMQGPSGELREWHPARVQPRGARAGTGAGAGSICSQLHGPSGESGDGNL